MSGFSVTAIDRLIEPAPTSSSPGASSMETESLSSTERKPPFSFYPPLYVTPPQQRPPSPSSCSPSPYVLNFKRRVSAKGTVGIDANDAPQQSRSSIGEKEQVEETAGISMTQLKMRKFTDNPQDSSKTVSDDGKTGLFSAERKWTRDENEVSDASVISAQGDSGHVSVTKEGSDGYRKHQSLENGWEGFHQGSSIASLTSEEFFDAPDAPFDGDSTSEDEAGLLNANATRSPIKSNEKSTSILQEEVSRRIRVEKDLASLQLRFNDMARSFSLIGSSLPSGIRQNGMENGPVGVDPFELFSEKLFVARLVGGAIASAAVRAVKEEELERMVTAKNWEISRLRDKLQYYELVNHEMSQRNQEAIEISQRRRRRRQKRQKWALGCFCAAFCIGTTGLLCYKFFPWEQARTWAKSLNDPVRTESILMELDSAETHN